MFKVFKTKSKLREEEAKKVILKTVFGPKTQKKLVTRAATQSAEDQKSLLEKYNKLMELQSS